MVIHDRGSEELHFNRENVEKPDGAAPAGMRVEHGTQAVRKDFLVATEPSLHFLASDQGVSGAGRARADALSWA